jgi:CRP-like cAMP-binding protein
MLSPVETMLHLRNLDLFEGLTTRQLAELASVVRETSFASGTGIVEEGEYDDSMYFIVEGRVRIAKGGREVAELGPKDFFGEMAVFDGERRSASATAVGDCRLLRLARGDLFEVMEDEPGIGIGICQTLVRRVRGLLDERSRA